MNYQDRVLLEHMLERIDRIARHTEQHQQDEKTQDAVERNLEIIGEAAGNLSKEVTDASPEIPWKDITGTRHKLIHDYLGIRTKTIWEIVEHELPVLKQQISAILKQL